MQLPDSLFARHEYLKKDDIAAGLQAQGIEASNSGDYEQAHELYAQALSRVPSSLTADTAAQQGSILRDDGFAYTRQAVAEQSKEKFASARIQLKQALAKTALLVSGVNVIKFAQTGEHDTYKKPRRELFSEHAATLGLIARTATAETVALDAPRPEAHKYVGYGLAHDFARLGTNGYFRVSNAMHGARDERLRGNERLIHAGVWVARAAFGIAWSVKNDRGNLKAAAGTFVRRLGDLRSVESAHASVLERP